jgi:hypothetical protein
MIQFCKKGFSFFWGARYKIQGFVHARQALSHWASDLAQEKIVFNVSYLKILEIQFPYVLRLGKITGSIETRFSV